MAVRDGALANLRRVAELAGAGEREVPALVEAGPVEGWSHLLDVDLAELAHAALGTVRRRALEIHKVAAAHALDAAEVFSHGRGLRGEVGAEPEAAIGRRTLVSGVRALPGLNGSLVGLHVDG